MSDDTGARPATERMLLDPEEIVARQAYDIPRVRLPGRDTVFRPRAARLRTLAETSTIGDYLRFVATIADAQQQQLDSYPALPLPPVERMEQNRKFGMPPLNAVSLQRAPAWRTILRSLLTTVLHSELPAPLRVTLEQFATQVDDYFEAQASKLLSANLQGLNVAVAPLLAAALQVYFVGMASQFTLEDVPALGEASLCPCCGSRATASLARIGAQEAGYRYLSCALCATEWHMVRVKCTQCLSTKDIHYQSIDDGRPGREHAVKAECCDACNTYLKILYLDRDPNLDACADDLASVALDVLVGETGRPGCGVNYMLVQGETAAP